MIKKENLENNLNNLKIIVKNQIELNKRGITPLYHGIKYEYINKLLLEDKELESRTYHRYWSDGLARKEHWDSYEDSCWKFGWACSRDFKIALNFGALICVFDRDKVKKHFSVEPFAWNYHIKKEYNIKSDNHKQEKEEFIVSKKTNICIREIELKKNLIESLILPNMYEIYKKMEKQTPEGKKSRRLYKKEIKEFEKKLLINPNKLLDDPQGRSLNLKDVLIGFYLNDNVCGIYDGRFLNQENENEMGFINKLKNHPLYLGTLNTIQMEMEQKKSSKLKM